MAKQIKIALDDGTAWIADLPTDRVVVSVDLHASMAKRGHAAASDDASKIRAYSRDFLSHNAIIYSLFRQLPQECGGDLVDFVADGALLTFDRSGFDSAVDFSMSLTELLGESGLDTSVGIDFGAVSTFALHEPDGTKTSFREIVGVVVDRAIRLAWIANPSQVLVGSTAVALSNVADRAFHVGPESPVEVTLDKWHHSLGEPKAAFTVQALSLHPMDDTMFGWHPANRRRLYLWLVDLLMRAKDFPQTLGSEWRCYELGLNEAAPAERYQTIAQMRDVLDRIEVRTNYPPPETERHPELHVALLELEAWCKAARKTVSSFETALRRNVGHKWEPLSATDEAPDLATLLANVVHETRCALTDYEQSGAVRS